LIDALVGCLPFWAFNIDMQDLTIEDKSDTDDGAKAEAAKQRREQTLRSMDRSGREIFLAKQMQKEAKKKEAEAKRAAKGLSKKSRDERKFYVIRCPRQF